jgi:hypothetical protein
MKKENGTSSRLKENRLKENYPSKPTRCAFQKMLGIVRMFIQFPDFDTMHLLPLIMIDGVDYN